MVTMHAPIIPDNQGAHLWAVVKEAACLEELLRAGKDNEEND